MIGVELVHLCNGVPTRDLVQWEPYGEARPLFTLISDDGRPISVEPHISCPTCGDRGQILNGTWVAMSRVPEGVHDTGPLAPVVVESKLYGINGGKDEQLPDREVELPQVQEGQPMAARHTPEQWAKYKGISVVDWDGFEGVQRHDLITEEDFDKRIVNATIWRQDLDSRERRVAKEQQVIDQGFTLKDSGERRGFDSGAVRDMSSGKGRYDLLQVLALKRIADIMEKGAVKYDARNWEKGMPLSVYTDSAMRHLMQWIEGKQDEDHLGQAAWNLLSAMQTEELIERGILPDSLDDMPNYVHPLNDAT